MDLCHKFHYSELGLQEIVGIFFVRDLAHFFFPIQKRFVKFSRESIGIDREQEYKGHPVRRISILKTSLRLLC